MSPAALALCALVACGGAHLAVAEVADPSSAPLVFLVDGQSNTLGVGSTPYEPGPIERAYMVTPDGTVPLYPAWEPNEIVPLADPTSDYSDATGGYSFLPRFAQRLRELGETRDIYMVSRGVAGSASATWLPTASPNLPNAVSTLIWTLQQVPGAVVGGVITYNGEADASGSTTSEQHAANWGAAYDYMSRLWVPWAKTTKFVHVKLPDETEHEPFWETVRTQQDLLDARADTIVVQAPNSATLHHDTGADDTTGLRKLGVDLANAWFAAS